MVDAKQGIKFGLVDQVVDTREMVLPAAEMVMEQVLITNKVVAFT